jgi:light-regulated signal transduction histidine kinase (bacteriophytochrome)
LLTNGDLILISSNAAADAIFDSKFSLRVGDTIEQLFPQLVGKNLPEVLRTIAREGGDHREETISLSEKGDIQKALEMTAFQPSPNEVAVHFQDITARVVYENEISSLNEELEQRVIQRTLELEASNREMEAFAYSVSHDLRAPVRAVKGFAEILLTEEDESGKIELIERIVEGGSRMDQLINDLLSLSRLGSQTLNMQEIDLSAIAETTFQDETGTIDRKIRFQVQETPPAMADQDMMRILLSNLINNAIKFSSTRETPKITFGYKEINGRGAYFLADNGVGFDMMYAEKIFSPFERLHASEYEGTGIGLAIVYRVIRRHEGHIWVETTPDQGATFYFTFDQPPLNPTQ